MEQKGQKQSLSITKLVFTKQFFAILRRNIHEYDRIVPAFS